MIVDFCTYSGDWPTYEMPYRTSDGLLFLMDRCSVDAACVSLAEGMFAFDARDANERLTQAIAGHRDRLWPVGTLDPTSPTWCEDLEHGLGRLDLAGFRLHPTYHRYTLDTPEALKLAARLAEVGRPLFVALQIEQEAFQHPALRAPIVPVPDLVRFLRRVPQTTVVLNSLMVTHALELLESGLSLEQVYFDVNYLDYPFCGLQFLVEKHGVERLLFGSQMPFLHPEAALLSVAHSGLSPSQVEAVLERNWQANPVLAGLASQRTESPAR